MFGTRTRSDASTAPTASEHRHAARGLGPFSGGQLTVIVVAVLVAVGFPVGAWAVSGSRVFVTDAVSGKTAAVNSLRQLSVTGAVTGQVGAPAAAGSLLVHFATASGASGNCQALFPANARAVVVTSIHLVVLRASNATPLYVTLWGNSGCGNGTTEGMFNAHVVGLYSLTPSSNFANGLAEEEVTISFPNGVAVAAGHTLLAQTDDSVSESINTEATTTGYTVPATQCASTTCY